MNEDQYRALESIHLAECAAHVLEDVRQMLSEEPSERRQPDLDAIGRGKACVHHLIAAEILLLSAYDKLEVTADDITSDFPEVCSAFITGI